MRRAVAILTLLGCLTFAVVACADSNDTEGANVAQGAVKGIDLVKLGDFAEPTYLTAPRGDRSRRFITERAGRIVLLRDGRRSTFLDIASRVQTGGESGLLSMAFHPGYANNRRYFVYYVDNSGAIVIAQYRATADGNRTRAGSGRTVLRQPHPRFNHKGGQLQFGRDGMLYAGLGDGGGGGDPDRNAQNLSVLLGKILRIDPKAAGGYRIPPDNPFVDRSGARGEIFAYGLRNPYRFSFDRLSGAMAIGDVGQEEVEEIDFLSAASGAQRPRGGANFGWSVFEGGKRYRGGTVPGHVRPVLQRFHSDDNCSITGGYVLRDPALGGLRGSYVYGDLCNPDVRIARLRPGGARGDRSLGIDIVQLVSFGEDARGRAYALSLQGGVWRLAPRR